MGVAHSVEIFGYLNLHIVGYSLVLLYAFILLGKAGVVGGGEELAHETKHTVYTLCKMLYLFLCFEHGDLRGLHDGIAADILQTELLFVFLGLWLDDVAYETLYLRNEPNEDKGVCDIECRVECSKDDRQTLGKLLCGERVVVGVVADKAAYHIHKRIEETENPDNSDDIKHEVGKSCSACLGVGTKGSEVGGGSGTNILAHDESDAEIYWQHASRA